MHWLLLLLLVPWARAHQTSVTASGAELFWPNPNVPIYVQTNTSDLDPATTVDLVQKSMDEWNSTGVVNLSRSSASNNEIRFSSDFSIYGSAVIGVTEISYNPNGSINKAVINLNDSYKFTNTKTSFGNEVYLGDVLTHEMGHLFGLSHSEVLSSSMFYTSFPGQSTISDDDRSGIVSKYGGSLGSISGQVRGGNQIGVLGVHVQAFSRTTGQSVGVITDEMGNFTIKGLNLGDSYYLYTSPIKHISSLPSYFANVQTQFCPGSYVGSFFSACGRENEGFPQAISLLTGSENVDVGVVTINCSLKANEDYNYQKIQSSFAPVTIWGAEEDHLREKAFVGFFRKPTSSAWTTWETLRVDLSKIPAAGKLLQVNLIGHAFGNLLEYELVINRHGSELARKVINYLASTGTYHTDLSVLVSLSSMSTENVYDVLIRAKQLSSTKVPLTFPSASLFGSDNHLPYLLVVGVGNGLSLDFNDQSFLSDNENCLDAPFTYQVAKTKSISEGALSEGNAAATGGGCGSIEPPQGGGPGSTLGVLSLGFGLALLVGQLTKKSKKFLS